MTKEIKEYLDSKIGKHVDLFELEHLNVITTCIVSSPEYADNNECIGGILEIYGDASDKFMVEHISDNKGKYVELYIGLKDNIL
jgi:hypothetical protein